MQTASNLPNEKGKEKTGNDAGWVKKLVGEFASQECNVCNPQCQLGGYGCTRYHKPQ